MIWPRANLLGIFIDQARSQKSAMETLCYGGVEAEPPAAGDNWESGGKASSRWRHVGLGAEPPVLKIFVFF